MIMQVKSASFKSLSALARSLGVTFAMASATADWAGAALEAPLMSLLASEQPLAEDIDLSCSFNRVACGVHSAECDTPQTLSAWRRTGRKSGRCGEQSKCRTRSKHSGLAPCAPRRKRVRLRLRLPRQGPGHEQRRGVSRCARASPATQDARIVRGALSGWGARGARARRVR